MSRRRAIQPSPALMQSAQRDEQEAGNPTQPGDDAERAAR
ncbi:hypothetical protein FJ05194_3600 [Mycobacterium tuberculosis FJ05194]|nr:hypothetical protein FJ05194_3599 [Mycobacterium tuberculosis FJ05194]EQM17924.1 hypothetical protein FJ05194_3600 [Mycobacterium tuberculosis FJ05194]